MPKTSMMLVHKPLSGMVGWFNADDLLNIAAELDKIEVPIVEAYAAKTGMQAKDIRKIMAKDMLMTAEEAVEAGFADEFDEKKDVDASINAAGDKLVVNGIQFDISQIRNFPKDKFRTDNSGARPHADASQPANAKPPELVPGSPAAVPSPIAARPDYGSYEAQIQLNRNAMNRLSLK
jgi:ATP-dependent Clp protease protease subunit